MKNKISSRVELEKLINVGNFIHSCVVCVCVTERGGERKKERKRAMIDDRRAHGFIKN